MPKKERAAPSEDSGEMIVPDEMQAESAAPVSIDNAGAAASGVSSAYRVLASMIQIRTAPVFPGDDNLRLRGAIVRRDEFDSPELEARYLELGAIEAVGENDA